MRRLVLNLTTLLSVVVCVAIASLWVRSYSAGDSMGVHRLSVDLAYRTQVEHSAIGIATGNGRLAFGTLTNGAVSGSSVQRYPSRWFCDWGGGGLVRYRSFSGLSPGPFDRQGPLGFDLVVMRHSPSGWLMFVPFWFLVLAFALMPLSRGLLARRAQRRTRLRQGLCPQCGYDLRATADRCPECGLLKNDGQTAAA